MRLIKFIINFCVTSNNVLLLLLLNVYSKLIMFAKLMIIIVVRFICVLFLIFYNIL